MSKLGQSSALLLVILVLVACQGSKQNGDTLTPDAAASEQTDQARQARQAASDASALEQTDQARQAASDASALEQIYQEGREAYQAGAALEQLGQRQEAMLKFNQAVGQFERVVLADPNHFNALVNWGSTLSRIGKPAAAVVKFQRGPPAGRAGACSEAPGGSRRSRPGTGCHRRLAGNGRPGPVRRP